MRIAGSTFLVTGGASGLGAAAARRLIEAGGQALLADLNRKAGNALVAELGARAAFHETNIADEASAKAAVGAALTAFGRLDGLVNCAGIVAGEKVVGKDGPHTLETFRHVIDINLVGSFNMIRLAAEAMVGNEPNADGERGVIVNTASVAAYEGQLGQAAYAASKGGIVAMTLPIARELARSQDGSLPGQAWSFRGIRRAGRAYRREPLSQWRSDPPGWRDPHAAKIASRRSLRS